VTWDDDPADAWDPATRTFDGLLLHRFMIRGEWSVPRLAVATRRTETTIRNALHGRPISDATTGAIARALRRPYEPAA
jgi:hypothetical protein